MGFDLTDTDEEVEASAWASLIAPLLRQKSICALKAELSICSVLEQIGHVWDCVSLSGFDFRFEADAGFEWYSGFTSDLGFDEEDEDEALAVEVKDVGLSVDFEDGGLDLDLGFDWGGGDPSAEISSSSISFSRSASSSSSSNPGIETS